MSKKRTSTTITKETRPNMPPRGRGKKALILESLREKAFRGLNKNSSSEEAEKAWFSYLVDTAINPDNRDSSLCLKLITERGWSALKPAGEHVSFNFDKEADLSEQAAQIINAVAEGTLSIDHGKMLIDSIKGLAEIKANGEKGKGVDSLAEIFEKIAKRLPD